MKELLITYKWKTQTAKEWEKETGTPAKVILDRLWNHWDTEAALYTPVKKRQDVKYPYHGGMYTASQLAKMHGGVEASTMRQRLQKHSVEEAMAMPNTRPHRKTRITEQKQKQMFQKPIEKSDTSQCKTCQYHANLGNSAGSGVFCAYSLINYHSRSSISPPSPNCTEYVYGKSIYRENVVKYLQKGAVI